MPFNPLNLIGSKTMSELGSWIKSRSNKGSKASNSLKMLPDGTIPGGQATAGASSIPVATDHTHGNKSQGDSSQAKYDASRKDDSITFMGKGQVDAFSNLTSPESVDRGGNAIAVADTPKPLAGQAPVLGTDYDRITPREEPVDIDSIGVNSLYNS